MRPYVFISHTSDDQRERVRPLARVLHWHKLSVWIDRHGILGLPTGQDVKAEVQRALRRAGAILVRLSRALPARRQVLVPSSGNTAVTAERFEEVGQNYRGSRHGLALMVTAAVWLGIGGQVSAQASYDDIGTPEGWAWAQIRKGKPADFNERCQTQALDPRAKDEARWADRCRQLSASFVVDIVNRMPWRDQIPTEGVRIVGANIEGDISLYHSKLNRSLTIERCRLGAIDLYAAQTDSVISFFGSHIAGDFYASKFRGELSLILADAEIMKATSLSHAKIGKYLDMSGVSLNDDFTAHSLQVGDSVFIQSTEKNTPTFRNIWMHYAKVIDGIEIEGATFEGNVAAFGLQVGGTLKAASTEQKETIFKGNVDLTGARVAGQVDFLGVTFERNFYAGGLQVGSYLAMLPANNKSARFKGSVDLANAKIGANLNFDGATIDEHLEADQMSVEGSIFVRNVRSNGRLSMIFVRTKGAFDLRGSTLAELDLSGAVIGGDLRLGSGGSWQPTKDDAVNLTLRDTRIANLVDSKDAWPAKNYLQIEGFTFARAGGFEGETGPMMRGRGMQWWDEWARRNRTYTPTPYEQLAAAFVAAGDRSAADEIRFLGQVRQRETEAGWWASTFTGFLQYVAGFGVGNYTFRVLYWVIGISFVGGLYLWACVPRARANGPIWCYGASLSRLLPVIEINKEFTDFFNDPKRRRLTGFQSFVFSSIGIMGWVLGAILVAAVSGLTQKS